MLLKAKSCSRCGNSRHSPVTSHPLLMARMSSCIRAANSFGVHTHTHTSPKRFNERECVFAEEFEGECEGNSGEFAMCQWEFGDFRPTQIGGFLARRVCERSPYYNIKKGTGDQLSPVPRAAAGRTHHSRILRRSALDCRMVMVMVMVMVMIVMMINAVSICCHIR